MKKNIGLIVVLAIASVASAATVDVTWTKSTAPNGMDSYILTFTGSDNLQAFDGSFTGDAINNPEPFGTVSVYSDDATSGLWTAAGMDPLNDSQFLLANADVLNTAKSESDTSLSAAFGIVNQVPAVQLVRIVVPTGNSFLGSGTIAISGTGVPFDVTVPEPATIALLGGGLGLLLRRKK